MRGMHTQALSKSVLVLDGERASALAIVRSLGKKGRSVDVGSGSQQPMAGLSRYCSRHFVYPDPLTNVAGFRQALLELLHQHSYSLIIPVTDRTICPLMEIRESVEALSPLAMASNHSLEMALSKSRTYELARTLGIPIPETVVISDCEELRHVENTLTYPVVIKTDRSKIWSSDGKGQDTAVAYALNPKDLWATVVPLLSMGPVVLQGRVGGEGVGVGILAAKGETLFAFQYRRLHEVPLTGGASSYRVSEAKDPTLIGYASSLLACLCWDGVAMVEFKRDKTAGTIHLMEINGRFWGSLPLAVGAGADFPSYLFDLMVHNRRNFPATYAIGFRCRQLPGELQWLKDVVLRRRPGGDVLFRYPSYRRVLADCCRLLNPMERTDTLDLWDPRPGIYDLRMTGGDIVHRVWKRLWCHRELLRMKRIQRHPRLLMDKLRCAERILVICHGNFIRSPFAALLLAQSVRHAKSISVHSAGFNPVPGGSAHPKTIAKAKSLGFDLSGHTAVPLTQAMVDRADLIFLMEIEHLFRMRTRFWPVRGNVFLLGCLAADVPLEISDPVGKDDAVYEACFEQIIKTVMSVPRYLSAS